MAVGMSEYLARKVLDAIGNNTALQIAQVYVKLHVGDPGADGTANAATETTRKAVSFAAAPVAVAGVVTMASDASISWTNIAGSQDATHASFWDDIAAGNYLGSGTITANAYTAGDTYTIASGGLTIALNVATT